jgi:hypothetical protein
VERRPGLSAAVSAYADFVSFWPGGCHCLGDLAVAGDERGPYCELTLTDGEGRPILTYVPIDSPFYSAEAILTLADHAEVWMTAASGDPHDRRRAACSVSGRLLSTPGR